MSYIENKSEGDIKNQAFSSMIWKFTERILAQIVSLLVSIILARLLMPEDYGLIGIVGIFFTFANVIISGGLNTSLIQKKDADVLDYSTVLYLSVIVSVVIYAVLFFTAPFIANIYSNDKLVLIIRVMGLVLPIYAIKSVVCAYVSSQLQFRKFFFATLGGTLVSAAVGIIMALNGCGVWALVAQQTVNTFIDTIMLLIATKMPVILSFSLSRMSALLKYGWKVFASSILAVIYAEATPLFIGIKFSSSALSYYTKGKSFPTLLSTTSTSTISAVLFPVMSKFQNDISALLKYTRKYIKLSSYISFPVMLGFFAVSENFVRIILTDKWIPAVFYIRIFCIVCMFDVIHIGNCEVIKAMGRSDIFLIMEIIKKFSYFSVIAMFMYIGQTPQTLAFSSIACTVIAIVVNTIPNIKLIGYSFKEQVVDLAPNLLISVIMCATVLAVGSIISNIYFAFLAQVLVGITVYISGSLITKNENFSYLINLLKCKLIKKYKGRKL